MVAITALVFYNVNCVHVVMTFYFQSILTESAGAQRLFGKTHSETKYRFSLVERCSYRAGTKPFEYDCIAICSRTTRTI